MFAASTCKRTERFSPLEEIGAQGGILREIRNDTVAIEIEATHDDLTVFRSILLPVKSG